MATRMRQAKTEDNAVPKVLKGKRKKTSQNSPGKDCKQKESDCANGDEGECQKMHLRSMAKKCSPRVNEGGEPATDQCKLRSATRSSRSKEGESESGKAIRTEKSEHGIEVPILHERKSKKIAKKRISAATKPKGKNSSLAKGSVTNACADSPSSGSLSTSQQNCHVDSEKISRKSTQTQTYNGQNYSDLEAPLSPSEAKRKSTSRKSHVPSPKKKAKKVTSRDNSSSAVKATVRHQSSHCDIMTFEEKSIGKPILLGSSPDEKPTYVSEQLAAEGTPSSRLRSKSNAPKTRESSLSSMKSAPQRTLAQQGEVGASPQHGEVGASPGNARTPVRPRNRSGSNTTR